MMTYREFSTCPAMFMASATLLLLGFPDGMTSFMALVMMGAAMFYSIKLYQQYAGQELQGQTTLSLIAVSVALLLSIINLLMMLVMSMPILYWMVDLVILAYGLSNFLLLASLIVAVLVSSMVYVRHLDSAKDSFTES